MSKSEPDARSRIELTDSADDIMDKCRKAVTDTTAKVSYDRTTRPGVSNLVDICAGLSGLTPDEVVEQCANMDTLQFKTHVAEVIIEHLSPITKEVHQLRNDPGYIQVVLQEGAEKATAIAQQTYNEVRKKVGFI